MVAVDRVRCTVALTEIQVPKLAPWTSSDYIIVCVHVYVQLLSCHFQGVKGVLVEGARASRAVEVEGARASRAVEVEGASFARRVGFQ